MMDEGLVDRVIYVVEGSTIKKKELKDDLVDHFCCLIEMDMNRGLDFDTAFERAQLQTAPNGLDEIQRETVFLLNYNRIIIMKKLTFIIGYLASLSLGSGIILRILQWDIGDWLAVLGAGGLMFLFLPLLFINRFKGFANQVLSEKMKWIMGILSGTVFTVAAFMKVTHTMGAGLMLGVSLLIFGIGFLPFLFFRMYKKSVEDL